MFRNPNVQFPESEMDFARRQIISVKEKQLGGRPERFRLEIGRGHRVFKVLTSELAVGSLAKAEQFGWGFPVGILGEGYPTALFEFRFNGSDTPGSWFGITEGELVKRLSVTFDTTASNFDPLVKTVRPFELAALWLPQVRIRALWMKGEGDDRSGDYFWPLSSPSLSPADQLGWHAHSYPEFVAIVQRYAKERLTHARSHKDGADPVGG